MHKFLKSYIVLTTPSVGSLPDDSVMPWASALLSSPDTSIASTPGEAASVWNTSSSTVLCLDTAQGEETLCRGDRNGFCCDLLGAPVDPDEGVLPAEGVRRCPANEARLVLKLDWLPKSRCRLGVFADVSGRDPSFGAGSMSEGDGGAEEDRRRVVNDIWYTFGTLDNGAAKR